MTTPAHIQELTDAIKANHPSVTFHDAYDIATLAFSMSAEICAEDQERLAAAMLQEKERCEKYLAAEPNDPFWDSLVRDWNIRISSHIKASRRIRALAVEQPTPPKGETE